MFINEKFSGTVLFLRILMPLLSNTVERCWIERLVKSSKEATARARACDASVLVNLDANQLVQLPTLASLIPV